MDSTREKGRKGSPTTQGVLILKSAITKAECKRRLEWLFEFLCQDTAAMKEADFKECMYQTLRFLYGDCYDDPEELRWLCGDTPSDRVALRKLQWRAALFMDSLLQDIKRSSGRSRPALVGAGGMEVEVLIDEGASYIKPLPGLRPSLPRASFKEALSGSRRSLSKTVSISVKRLREIRESAEDPDDCIIFDRAFDLDIWRSLSIALGAILNAHGIPKIRRCQSCRTYFMHTAAKRSRLCRSCYSKRNTMRWRDKPENREAYNAYQRNRRKGVEEGGPAAIRDSKRNEGS